MSYKIDLHMHTVASTHAYSTIHEYVQMAKLRGLKLINISDHGPKMEDAPHIWHFGNFNILPRIIDGVIVLKSMEANILNIDGEIDCPKHYSEKFLDFTIAGFHESAQQSCGIDDNTTSLINVIKSQRVQMISHPGNPKYPIHIDQVAAAAAKYNVALELNNSSFTVSRLGSEPNCIKIVEAVKKAGGLIGLGSDSHIAYNVGEFDHCERVLDLVEFPKDRVLNQSVEFLFNFIKTTTGKHINLEYGKEQERFGLEHKYQHKG
ncbi:alkaline phosphatase [Gammaproteobacteria bacterium]|nr:alkaline phosphatase [Gammaproteobacteria bacterium]